MTARYAHLGVYSDWVAAAPGPRARAARPTPSGYRVRREVAAPRTGFSTSSSVGEPSVSTRL